MEGEGKEGGRKEGLEGGRKGGSRGEKKEVEYGPPLSSLTLQDQSHIARNGAQVFSL